LFASNAFSHDDQLNSSAKNLVISANHFAELVRYKTGYSYLYYDAKKLAFIAGGLTSSIVNNSKPVVVRSQFRKVKSRFVFLSHQLRRAHRLRNNNHILYDFQRLQNTFHRLENTVSSNF